MYGVKVLTATFRLINFVFVSNATAHAKPTWIIYTFIVMLRAQLRRVIRFVTVYVYFIYMNWLKGLIAYLE